MNNGRLARTETEESSGTIAKKGRDAWYTTAEIKAGISNVNRAGADPSRATALNSRMRSLGVHEELWRKQVHGKTPLTFSVPIGASPSYQFYDAMIQNQTAAATAV